MSLTVDNHADFTTEQLTAVRAGLERMNCPNSTRVVVSTDFVGDVRTITGSASYDIARGTGVVGAKTIPLDSGQILIVVNADIARGLDMPRLERLLAHEAGHALIADRGEHHPDTRSTWMGDKVLHSLAATALDEYRVERAVLAEGLGPADGVTWEDAGDLATEVNIAVMTATTREENKGDPALLAGDVTSVHDWSSKKLAYMAAAVASGVLSPVVDVPDLYRDDWTDYLSGGWVHRLRAYHDVPDAGTPIDPGQLDRAINRLAVVERHHMKALGFFYKEHRGTWGFHRRKEQSVFDSRWRRAVASLEAAETP